MKLTRSKLRLLSTVSANFSEVFLASFVLPTFVGGLDNIDPRVFIFGIVAVIISVWLALLFAEKGKL